MLGFEPDLPDDDPRVNAWGGEKQIQWHPSSIYYRTIAAFRPHRNDSPYCTAIAFRHWNPKRRGTRSPNRTCATGRVRPRDSDGTFLVIMRQAVTSPASPVCLTTLIVDRRDGLENLRRFLQHFLAITNRYTTLNVGGADTRVQLGTNVTLRDVANVLRTIQDATIRRPIASRPR